MNQLDRQRRKVRAEAAGRNGAAAKTAEGGATADEPRGLQTTALTEIRPEPVRFLVEGYLPLGKLVLIAGDGGHGKSSLTLHLTAAVTRGRPAFGLQYDPPPPAPARCTIFPADPLAAAGRRDLHPGAGPRPCKKGTLQWHPSSAPPTPTRRPAAPAS